MGKYHYEMSEESDNSIETVLSERPVHELLGEVMKKIMNDRAKLTSMEDIEKFALHCTNTIFKQKNKRDKLKEKPGKSDLHYRYFAGTVGQGHRKDSVRHSMPCTVQSGRQSSVPSSVQSSMNSRRQSSVPSSTQSSTQSSVPSSIKSSMHSRRQSSMHSRGEPGESQAVGSIPRPVINPRKQKYFKSVSPNAIMKSGLKKSNTDGIYCREDLRSMVGSNNTASLKLSSHLDEIGSTIGNEKIFQHALSFKHQNRTNFNKGNRWRETRNKLESTEAARKKAEEWLKTREPALRKNKLQLEELSSGSDSEPLPSKLNLPKKNEQLLKSKMASRRWISMSKKAVVPPSPSTKTTSKIYGTRPNIFQ